MNAGITYIEVLVLVALISIVSFISTPFFSHSLLRNNTTTATELIENVIRKAQLYSVNGKNNAVWGVCITSGKIRLFTGTCAAPVIREDTTLPKNITITGLSETTFSKFRGEPSSSRTITIQSGIKTQTIVLNPVGGMDIN